VSKYNNGEYVPIEIVSETDEPMSIWMRVDQRDDKRSIVFETIDGDAFHGLNNALRPGAKLTASYRGVRKCRARL
jgi:hypothetical protein